MLSQETLSKISVWRQKVQRGEQLSRDEMREAVRLMREDRVSASISSGKARAKKAPVDADALLKELEGL